MIAFDAADVEAKKYDRFLANAQNFGVKKSALTAATLGFVNFTVENCGLVVFTLGLV